jgi:hypothetical protein
MPSVLGMMSHTVMPAKAAIYNKGNIKNNIKHAQIILERRYKPLGQVGDEFYEL